MKLSESIKKQAADHVETVTAGLIIKTVTKETIENIARESFAAGFVAGANHIVDDWREAEKGKQ